MDSNLILFGITWYVVFLFSTTCHEAAHALAAKLGGDLTAARGGQVSLDPIPHIRREPFGMVIFPILSYVAGGWMMGWASAPYDPFWAQRYPKRAAWMSLAGPAANLSLAIVAAILIRVGMMTGFLTRPQFFNFAHIVSGSGSEASQAAAALLSILFSLNLLLGVFNLLPLPPLDGFGAVGVLLPESGARRFQIFGMQIRRFSLLGLLIAWRVFDPLFFPIFGIALRALFLG
jgi:Zn-dependent protease